MKDNKLSIWRILIIIIKNDILLKFLMKKNFNVSEERSNKADKILKQIPSNIQYKQKMKIFKKRMIKANYKPTLLDMIYASEVFIINE